VPVEPSGPEEIADEGQALPAGYRRAKQTRTGLLITGAVMLGAAYSTSALVGTASNKDGDGWLLLPVFGPLIASGERSGGAGDDQIAYLMFFAGQATGAVLLGYGLLSKRSVFLRDAVAADATPTVRWGVTPLLMGRGPGGLGVVGEF
jgi:hypothetical protein